MLEASKEVLKSSALEQKNLLDTILDGAQKAAQVVSNIKSISSGSDPKPLEPLYKDTQRKEEDMVKPPQPPSFMAPKSQNPDPIVALCENISTIRQKVEKWLEEPLIPRDDIKPVLKDLYEIHLAAFNMIKK